MSWPERWLAIKSLFLLQAIAICLRWFGFKPVFDYLKRSATPGSPIQADPEQAFVEAIQLGALVQLANQRFKRLQVTCLPESLVVWWMLNRRNIQASLRLGIRNQDGRLDGHAWVEVNERVVSGDPDLPGAFQTVHSA